MISADQLPASHKEHLNNRVLIPEIRAFIHRCRNDIPVLLAIRSNFLTFSDHADTPDQIPALGSVLETHLLRRLSHFFRKLIYRFLEITVQKPDHFTDLLLIFFLRHFSRTGSRALFHMIIKAGTILPEISWKRPVTGAHPVQLPHKLDHIFHCTGACIWAEIAVLVFLHPPGKKHPGIRLLDSNLNERITLVILQHGIVFGTVFLDKITLKYKSLKFRICDDILKSRDMGNHLLDLRPFIPAALKILPHTVFKAYRLTYINDLIFLIMHEIHARFCGKFF